MTDSMRCRGMRDMLPEDMERFRRIEAAFRNVCLGWGYGEVRTPTIEHLHLFTSAGTLSPQMLDRVYSFLDWDGWSGERVVLRPDSTIPSSRLYTENFAPGDTARLFYVQNVIRFEQGEESREDYQCGVELIGDTQPQGDVELILMACETLQALGLEPQITLSDPGILRAVFEKAGYEVHEQIALLDRVLDGDVTRARRGAAAAPGLGVSLPSVLTLEGEGAAYLDNLRATLSGAVPGVVKSLDELSAVSQALSSLDIAHRVSPVLVRNFEYYTGPVFHASIGDEKVGGGGRYDALLRTVSGADVAASGFALEMERIAPLLSAEPKSASAITLRAASKAGSDMTAAFQLARALRAAGCRVEIAAEGQPPARREVVVAADGFLVTSEGGEARKLSRVDEVVQAVAARDQARAADGRSPQPARGGVVVRWSHRRGLRRGLARVPPLRP